MMQFMIRHQVSPWNASLWVQVPADRQILLRSKAYQFRDGTKQEGNRKMNIRDIRIRISANLIRLHPRDENRKKIIGRLISESISASIRIWSASISKPIWLGSSRKLIRWNIRSFAKKMEYPILSVSFLVDGCVCVCVSGFWCAPFVKQLRALVSCHTHKNWSSDCNAQRLTVCRC